MTAAALSAFEGRLFAPARPRLVEALSAVTNLEPAVWHEVLASPRWSWDLDRGLDWASVAGETRTVQFTGRLKELLIKPSEAWETFAARGIIPDDWVGSTAQRGFAVSHDRYCPFSIEACINVASQAAEVVAAERYAREVYERLGGFSPGHALRIVWKTPYTAPNGGPTRGLSNRMTLPLGGPPMWVALALAGDPAVVPPPPRRGRERLPPPAAPTEPRIERVLDNESWADGTLVETALDRLDALSPAEVYPERVRIAGRDVPVPAAIRGQRRDALGDWQTPLRALYQLGFGLEWISKRAITLIFPSLPLTTRALKAWWY